MSSVIAPFSDEQLRILVNLQQRYEVWLEAERSLAALPYGLKWKRIGGGDYLYEVLDRQGNGKSLGPRSPETAARYEHYRTQKNELKERRDRSARTLDETARLYRAVRLPQIDSHAAEILREADRRSLLGRNLLVVGTNAMAAYAIEAGGRIADAPDETADFDLAWVGPTSEPAPVWSLLKAVDSTYTVNSERTHQARNADAYEVELLVAPSIASGLGSRDHPIPVPLPEQEWLLLGRPLSHVVIGRNAAVVRLVVPDPRWFALQKLWLADQSKRDPLKRPKDRKQGDLLLRAVREAMPHYPLDAAFEAELPQELRSYYGRWQQAAR
jgi:hypothetical protein